MNCNKFKQFPIDWKLGFIQIFVTVNNTAVKIHI